MKLVKNNLLKICLIFMMFLAGAVCIYSVVVYSGTTTEMMENTQQINTQRSNSSDSTAQQSAKNNLQTQTQRKDLTSGNQSTVQSQNQNTHTSTQNANIQYAPLLAIYALIFLSLFSWVYFVRGRIKTLSGDGKNDKLIIVTVLIVALLMRISLATVIQGYSGDISLFKSWATAAAKDFSNLYASSNNIDYPPLYIYILAIIGKLANIGIFSKYYILMLKLPSILADVATSLILYNLSKKRFSIQISLLLAAFYAFNPATFLNSALWGQVDSLFTLLVVLSFYFLSEKKITISAIFFALSILMKPQGIIFAPVLLYELVREISPKNFIKAALAGLVSVFVVILPFSYQHGFLWIFELYSGTIAKYPYASMNAFNFFSLIGGNMTNYNNTLLLFS
ncbi:DUF2029 domain-containing protein [Acetobacterium paludosum]|uniref:DUF2029 domain-containing protein n=1 Tax=Acetobacterium paludosum TaxID=52693 RepID=A0A923I3Q6_9FIRM|nr:glycosyltransferase family 39 protein [Acetobacterium paludosum]MBC3889393.1 DUF2029 domain-containing protein [Acetobacterium paludosum]